MNLFNRIVIVTLLILLFAVTLLSLLVPRAVLGSLRDALDWIEATVPFYNILRGAYWAYLGVGLGVMLLCALLLWLELRHPPQRTARVQHPDGSWTEVSVKSIAQRLANEVSQVADVNKVKPKVISRGKKVDVYLDLQVHPAVELPAKSEELARLTREIIEEQMGIKVRKVRVNIRYGPEGARPLPEPTPPPTVEPAPPPTAEVETEAAPE